MVSTAGLMFPACTGVGYLWGKWMDSLFGVYPWLTFVFTAIGIFAAFLNLFRLAKSIAEEDKNKK